MEMGEGAGGRGYIKDNRSEYKEPGATRGAENRHGSEGSQQCHTGPTGNRTEKDGDSGRSAARKNLSRDIIRDRVGGG